MKRWALLLLCAALFACGVRVAPESEALETQTAAPTPEETPVRTTPETTPETTPVTFSPAPTEAPTPSPTPEPTAAPEIIDEERLASGEFDPYFDDAVFVGDSITATFRNYVTGQRAISEGFLGEAKFLGVTNMSAIRAARNSVGSDGINFRFRGRELCFTDAIRETGAKKVFILLGVNELVWCTWEDETAAFSKMFELIRSVDPDAEIVVPALLPVTERYCKSERLQIDTWNSFNEVLSALCEENEVAFLSFAEQVMDENGYLDVSLSIDKEYHLNEKGEAIWVAALRRYAAARIYPDAIFVTP